MHYFPLARMRRLFHLNFFLVPLMSYYSTFSQDNRISLLPAMNLPLGELGWSYGPGAGVKLNYSVVDVKKKTFGWRATGISVGYSVLPPLADTLYYLVDKGGAAASGAGVGIGTAVFDPFRMFHLEGTIDWGLPVIRKKLFITPALTLGLLYGQRGMTFEDSFGGSDDLGEFVTWATVSVRPGVGYQFSESFGAQVFAAYTVIIQMGSTDPGAMNYNPDTGLFYHFCSPGVALNFSFF